MRKLLFAPLLMLAACAGGYSVPVSAPPPPVVVADKTILDEQVATGVELAYKAARTTLELAVDLGRVKGANAVRAADLDNKAFRATQAVQRAYVAGNSDNYKAAFVNAKKAIADLLAVTGSK